MVLRLEAAAVGSSGVGSGFSRAWQLDSRAGREAGSTVPGALLSGGKCWSGFSPGLGDRGGDELVPGPASGQALLQAATAPWQAPRGREEAEPQEQWVFFQAGAA